MFYSNYQPWKDWSSKKFGELTPANLVYFDRELCLSGASIMSIERVLEIGFGNGSFAAWAAERGVHQYLGTEQIIDLVVAARHCGIAAHSSDEPVDSFVAPDSLDLIVAFDVFEHIEIGDLRVLLGTLARCLKPGGLLVARVPSGDSPFSRAIQNGDLTHKTTLGSSSIRQLVESLPFEVMQIRGPAFPIRGLGFRKALKRGLVKVLRQLIYPFIKLILMGGMPSILEPNIVFVLKKPFSCILV
jgi:SAM-dependent methyltransferase